MSDKTVAPSKFADAVAGILDNLENGVTDATPEAVRAAIKVGAKNWRRNAREEFSGTYIVGGWGKPGYGRKVTAGKYARSIRCHMLNNSTTSPEGEVGSSSMPGLPHLLEKGHAKVGGGMVPGREHIANAANDAFEVFEATIDEAVERAIDDA